MGQKGIEKNRPSSSFLYFLFKLVPNISLLSYDAMSKSRNVAFNPRHSLLPACFSRQYVKETVAPNDNLVQGMNSMVPFIILIFLKMLFIQKYQPFPIAPIGFTVLLYYVLLLWLSINSILWFSIFLESEVPCQCVYKHSKCSNATSSHS